MIIENPYSSLIHRFVPPFRDGSLRTTPVHNVVASGENSELCYLTRAEDNQDPEYWYVTSDGLKAVFGLTGMLQSVEKLTGSGLELVLNRANAYGNFFDGKKKGLDAQETKPLIDGIYSGVASLHFMDEKKRKLFGWDFALLLRRFEEYARLFDSADIIPEYSDLMTPIKVSHGCNGNCIYCSEPSKEKFTPFSEERIKGEIAAASGLQQRYHPGQEQIMNEGFVNTADILQLNRKGGADPLRIIELFKASFPYTQKLYTFMSVSSVIEADQHYLEQLFSGGNGINRALIGIETADAETSAFLGKKEGYSQKREALQKLKRAGFKVKPIVQVGMVGEGFNKNGTFISSRQGLEATARLIGEFLSYTKYSKKPDKVHISVYTPLAGTPLKRLHEQGTIITPYSSPSGLEEDINFFIERLGKHGASTYSQVELGYESALQGRRRLPE